MGNCIQLRTKRDKLQSINANDVPRVVHHHKIIPAKIVKVYDGDTVTVIFSLGGEYLKYNIRLFGIDAPEIRGSSPLEKQAAEMVRDILIKVLPINSIRNLRIESHDKYGGRLVGDLFIDPTNDTTASDWLLAGKFVKIYSGKSSKIPWTDTELKSIITQGESILNELS